MSSCNRTIGQGWNRSWTRLGYGLVMLSLALVAYGAYGCFRLQPQRLIRLGERQERLLRAADPNGVTPPCGPEHIWAFEGQAGQKMTIAAESYEFNTYLLLSDSQGRAIAWDDDSGWFLNARIRTTLPTTGRYSVIVCGENADQYGTYWLSLEAGDRETDVTESAVSDYYRQGIEWAERAGSHRAVSLLNLALGRYWRERRNWERAEAAYDKSQAAAERGDDVYGQWAVALERGMLNARRMRYDEAIKQLEAASALGKRVRAADQAEALTAIQLGELYQHLDRAELVAAHYRTATERVEQSGAPSALARLYTSLFSFVWSQDKRKAVEYAERAYALRDGVDPALEVAVLSTLAGAHFMSGHSDEFLKLAAEARERAHRLGCSDKEVALLNMMSIEYLKQKRGEDAIRSAREAVALTDADDEDLDPRRTALQLQAQGEMLKGNHETAVELCMTALQTTEEAWARQPIEEVRQDFLSQSKAISTQIIRNLYALNARHRSSELVRQSFDFAERSRSRALLDQLAAARAGVKPDAEALKAERRLVDRISTVGRQIVLIRGTAKIDVSELDRLEKERARLVGERIQLEALTRRQTSESCDQGLLSPLTAEQVQKEFLAAHADTAILYYQLGAQESFLIVLTRENAHLFKLPGWATIGKAVTEWRAQIRYQMNPPGRTTEAIGGYAQVARRLYDMLIKPAAGVIRGRELIIVPDGVLHTLAFEALVASEVNHGATSARPVYLVERHVITYAPSISVLTEIERRRQTAKPNDHILLVGDPVFSGSDSPWAPANQPATNQEVLMAMGRRERFGGGLTPLPATRQEVMEIARLAERHNWTRTVLLGREASEERLTSSELSSYRVLHLATHAVADDKAGGFSALALSLDEKPAGGDGVWTAAEIARMKLTADLVVVSGCETGTGQEAKAEGVIGLSRAFMVAGAQRVCGSIWKVEDTATQKLMTTFYDGLLTNGLAASRALQQAKLAMLRSGAAPFYWAPFILVGPPR